ncbi:hypothetical protein K438DRAFT_1775142 [Mycena galopus ATCC 62051]|nr:hypothetical protein K438DRAFT_1775142 [Mycena galopus ATCC 62051]
MEQSIRVQSVLGLHAWRMGRCRWGAGGVCTRRLKKNSSAEMRGVSGVVCAWGMYGDTASVLAFGVPVASPPADLCAQLVVSDLDGAFTGCVSRWVRVGTGAEGGAAGAWYFVAAPSSVAMRANRAGMGAAMRGVDADAFRDCESRGVGVKVLRAWTDEESGRQVQKIDASRTRRTEPCRARFPFARRAHESAARFGRRRKRREAWRRKLNGVRASGGVAG